MAKAVMLVLEKIIREEEQINSQYEELIKLLDQPELIEKVKQFQAQGWARIGELHGMWKGQRDTKP